MKRFCLTFTLFVLAFCLTGCNPSQKPGALEKIKILIDWQAVPTYIGVYFAKSEGLFEKAGFDAEIVQSWGANQAVSAVASGQYLIGTSAGGATVLGVDRGREILSTGVLCQKITSTVYGLATNGINKPQDLYGKTIGMWAGSIVVNEFQAFAKLNSVDRSKIKEVLISGGDIEPLKAGALDAVLNYLEQSPTLIQLDPDVPIMNGRKANIIRLADYGVKGYGLNIITSKSAWSNNRQKVQALTNAIIGGYRMGLENPDAAVKAFLRIFPEKNPEYVRAGWKVVCGYLGPAQNVGVQTVNELEGDFRCVPFSWPD